MRGSDATISEEVCDIAFALLGPREAPDVDEADLLALALGVANHATRESCATAILGSPRTAARLRGWTAEAEELEGTLGGATGDERRRLALAHYAQLGERARRGLAEGIQEGDAILRRSLVGLRVGWRLARALGDHEAGARFAEGLAAELMERGAWDELAELAQVGYQASDALATPTLRSRLLSYEGAAAARRGDVARATELWTARVELNRLVGNPVAEADALLDLAGEALQASDGQAWAAWIDRAEDAVARSGRADLEARLWTSRAHERLWNGDSDGASSAAGRALATLSGSLGSDVGFYVRIVAAKALGATGQPRRALRALAEQLALAVERVRPGQAASIAEAIASLAATIGAERLASLCEAASKDIHALLATRHAPSSSERTTTGGVVRWDLPLLEALALIEEMRPEQALA